MLLQVKYLKVRHHFSLNRFPLAAIKEKIWVFMPFIQQQYCWHNIFWCFFFGRLTVNQCRWPCIHSIQFNHSGCVKSCFCIFGVYSTISIFWSFDLFFFREENEQKSVVHSITITIWYFFLRSEYCLNFLNTQETHSIITKCIKNKTPAFACHIFMQSIL